MGCARIPPTTNNHGVRELRSAVIGRKVTQSNRRDRGAGTQAGLMSILRALHRRGSQATDALVESLPIRLRDGKQPPFPAKSTTVKFFTTRIKNELYNYIF
ncbi:MAG TPA: hypothetical protein PLH79_17475 [bacterium]|nr:hypothetical protein [bacterium]